MKILVDEYSNNELKNLLRRIYSNDISVINRYNKIHYLGKSAYDILSKANYNISGNYLIIYSTVEYTFYVIINNEGKILGVYTSDGFPMDEDFNFVAKNEVMETINTIYGDTIELICVMGILYELAQSLPNRPYVEDYGFMPEIIEHVGDDMEYQFIADYFPDTKLICFNNVKINGNNNVQKVEWLYSVSSQPYLYVTDNSVSYIDTSTDTHIIENDLDNETLIKKIINYISENIDSEIGSESGSESERERDIEKGSEPTDDVVDPSQQGLMNRIYSYIFSFITI